MEPGSEREGQIEGTQPPVTMPTDGDRGYKISLLSHSDMSDLAGTQTTWDLVAFCFGLQYFVEIIT